MTSSTRVTPSTDSRNIDCTPCIIVMRLIEQPWQPPPIRDVHGAVGLVDADELDVAAVRGERRVDLAEECGLHAVDELAVGREVVEVERLGLVRVAQHEPVLEVERRTLQVRHVVVGDHHPQTAVVAHLLAQRERREGNELEVVDEVDALAAVDRQAEAERVALGLLVAQLGEPRLGSVGERDDVLEDELVSGDFGR